MKKLTITAAWVAACALTASIAEAVQEPAHLTGHPALELADGSAVRQERALSWHRHPRAAAPAWGALRADMGATAQAVWDPVTGVPSRVWGEGIAVPGSVASAARAESFAKRFLARHIALLAPGAAPGDFVMVSNDLDDGMRTVGLVQHVAGLPVLGGQVSFRFKADRMFMIGSEALPHASAASLVAKHGATALRGAAERWMLFDLATVARAQPSVAGPFVLPLVDSGLRFVTVMRVTVDTEPLGRWHVYVDAVTGDVVAREQTLRFAAGTVHYNVPRRRPGTERADYPAMFTSMSVGGVAATSDAQGLVSWSSGDGSVTTGVSGDYIAINNVAGAETSTTLPVPDGGSAVWQPQGEYADAQVTTFIHANFVKEYARGFSDIPYLAELLPANVNINNSCNAFYDGASINFFRAAGGCGNTGRIADVVYHEFGHALHDNAIIPGVGAFDGAASEGLSDYLAATITGDAGMGRGFHGSDEPLRDVDPPNAEHVWPDDIGEIHYTGLIIAGALWDMRKALVDSLGEAEGVAVADRIYYQAMRRAVDIPTMYFEALAADDDDGDLTNGTPHICEINAGFTPHGLREITAIGSKLSVEPPHQEGYTLSLALTGLFHTCPSDDTQAAEVEWRLRGQPEVGGVLPMSLGPTGFEAVIPTQPDGSVVQYRVTVAFQDGSETYPHNPADPYYELFVGHTVPLYCTDFETDPFADGWTHGLTAGEASEGADDWQWGPTLSPPESGDPTRPYSGDNVLGNDLGGNSYNGAYQANKVNYAQSPPIDTSGYEVVRLQYRRWLTVEDHSADAATIYADDEVVWTNAESAGGDLHHVDETWRFTDVDISAQAADSEVVVRFELSTDGGVNLGGWTIDDLCVVGYVPTVCGDGLVTGLEACDDGVANSDTAADACRSECLPASCGDGVVDSGEDCDDGNADDTDGCDVLCVAHVEEGGPGGGTLPGGAAAAEPLHGIICGCHTVGEGGRSSSYAWLCALALGLAYRRRFAGREGGA